MIDNTNIKAIQNWMGDYDISMSSEALIALDGLLCRCAALSNAEPIKLSFPTMLRKMWSGGEVQAWLDENPVFLHPSVPAPQWTPIETLPPDWGSYLVWHKNYGMETLWFQFKDGGLDGRKAGNWYSEDDGDEDDSPKNYRVSHWMPLPSAPLTNTGEKG